MRSSWLAAGALIVLVLAGLALLARPAVFAPSPTFTPTQSSTSIPGSSFTSTAAPSPLPPTPAASRTPTQTAVPSLTTAPLLPTFTPTWKAVDGRRGVQVPILLYHHVSDDPRFRHYGVTVADFERQMRVLAEEGYRSVTVTQLALALKHDGMLPERWSSPLTTETRTC